MTDARTKKIGFGKRLLTAAASLVMLATCAVTAMPAHAANTAPTEKLTFNFNKYLVMDENANVPNATFKFSIAAGTAIAATDGTPAIYAGVGNPTVEDAVFTPSTGTQDGLPAGVTGEATGKKYATDEVTVDFRGVTFNAPGIYRYVITENATSIDGIINDAHGTRTLDVVVQYAEGSETNLEVADYVLYYGTKTDANNESGETKNIGFANTYTTSDLTLTKDVTGNQGDRDKYFKFTVTISNAVPGTQYDVTAPAANLVPGEDRVANETDDSINKTSLTVDGDGNVDEAVYYLKDNDSVVIKGLTENTKYTITETSYAADGYETSYVLGSGSKVENNTTGEKSMSDGHTVTFTNAKQGTVPTGILLDVAPYIVLVALVGVGIIALFATKKRRSR